MMSLLTKEQLNKILDSDQIEDTEAIEVIRKYIFDCKKVDIKGINRPNNNPTFVLVNNIMVVTTNIELMFKMYIEAKSYYKQL
jgi:actin-related protein